MVNNRRGRPRGPSDARERILNAARKRFREDGYAAVSVRSIAREAGVDHTLVNYHFGSKQAVFGAVLAVTVMPGDVLDRVFADGEKQLATRLLGTVITVWDHARFSEPLLVALRSADADATLRAGLSSFVGEEIYAGIRDHLDGPDAAARAAGVMTVVAGLIFGRYVLAIEPLASMTREQLVRTLAPMLEIQLAARGRRSHPHRLARSDDEFGDLQRVER